MSGFKSFLFAALRNQAAFFLLFFWTQKIYAQCPEVVAVMVDACATEQLNEFVIIQSGGGFNTADIQLDYDQNNNILGPTNNDININNDNDPGDPTPCGLAPGNLNAYSGCANLIAVGPGVDIPANAIVVLQTSANATANTYNFGSLCGMGQCVYVIASTCPRTAGAFTNGGSGLRTTVFQINGACTQTITYDRALLTGGNGAYYLPLTNTYGNTGCVSPPSPPAPMPPAIDPINNVTQCGAYTLPPIPGTNLTPNAAYYTAPNGGGTQYQPGDEITATITLYAFDQLGPQGCSSERQFTVTITPAPTVDQPADLVVCPGPPNAAVTFTGGPAGTMYAWTNSNTAIGLGASGTGNINFTPLNAGNAPEVGVITVTPSLPGCPGDPVSFTITVNPRPTVQNPGPQEICAGETLTVVFDGTNNPTFNWTNSNTGIGLGASGAGDINFTGANVPISVTGTIVVTPTEDGCVGASQTFTITVRPLPTVNQAPNLTRCGGQNVAVNFSGTPGATFSWTNDNPAIGLGASGTGNISFVTAGVVMQEVGTIVVTPELNGCEGAPMTFAITVNPGPEIDPPGDAFICSGELLEIVFTSPNGVNPTFNWTNSNTAIGLGASGMGNISFTAANVMGVQTSVVTVIATEDGCVGPAQTFAITVSPAPLMTQPGNVTQCLSGQPVLVNFNSITPGPVTYSWTNNNPAIGLPASGTGNINFTPVNNGMQQTATIVVTPSLNGCTGASRTFTITLNPAPTMSNPGPQVACGGDLVEINFVSPTNPTFNWQNSNAGIGLPNTGSGNISFVAAQSGNTISSIITVTPFENNCVGPQVSFFVTINPTPVMNQPADVTLCAQQTLNLDFDGSAGATFNWTNNNVNIGLPASGSGNINFTAPNLPAADTALLTVSPTLNGCTGDTLNFSIVVRPLPQMDTLPDQTFCAGTPVAINFSGPGMQTYDWTNSNPAIGLPASGSGNLSFSAADVSAPETGAILVTPTQDGCPGAPILFQLTVNPTPDVNPVGDLSVCNGETVSVNFDGTAGATFSWTNDNPAIGLPAAGAGNLNFTAMTGANPQMAQIAVAPTLGPCAGDPISFAITVNPGVSVNNPGSQQACIGETVEVNFVGAGNPVFDWTNDNTAIGLAASGTGDISFVAAAAGIANLTVTPVGPGCAGAAQTFAIEITDRFTAQISGPTAICEGESALLMASGGPVFQWSTGESTADIAVSPAVTTNYSVIVSKANGACADTASVTIAVNQPDVVFLNAGSCSPADTGLFTVSLSNQFGCDSIVITQVDLLPSFEISILATSCDPAAAGVFVQNLQTVSGCDSIITTTVFFDPAAVDTTLLSAGSCDPAQVGVSQVLLSNAAGCDSLVITNTVLLPSYNETITTFSCNPAALGVFVQNLQTIAGCDSIVTTIVEYTSVGTDSTLLSAGSCDPAQVGVTQTLLTNAAGCDSLVILNTVLLPSYNLSLTATTCFAAQAGTFVQNLQTAAGCDSIVTTVVVFDASLLDTTLLTLNTCDPSQAGITQTLLTNALGCDSLVIATTVLQPSYNLSVNEITCIPTQAGTFVQNLQTAAGCDSVVTRIVTFDPSLLDTVYLDAVTCNPAQAGVTQTLLTNSLGCDSLVVTNTVLLPSYQQTQTAFTCDPAQAGVVTLNLQTTAGCDSIITINTLLNPSYATTVNQTTCDPSQVGSFVQTLQTVNGCDSIITTVVSLDLPACAPTGVLSVSAPLCSGTATGVLNVTVQNGQSPPFSFVWSGPSGSGIGQVANVGGSESVSGLLAGVYGVTLTDANGLSVTLSANIPAKQPITLSVNPVNVFNGFGLRCANSQDGAIGVVVSGATLPISYLWNNGADTSTLSGVSAGSYSLTVTDANGCTALGSATLTAPPPIKLSVTLDRPDCGDLSVDANISASGGVGPLRVLLDGNLITSLMPDLAPGQHTISVVDANDCNVDSTFVATVPPIPVLFLPADTAVVFGSALTLAAVSNLDTWSALTWSPLQDSTCANCLTQTWRPTQSGRITLTLTDSLGCTATASTLVRVERPKQVYLPNIISLSASNGNEYWSIGAGPGVARIDDVRIFDRWGSQIYQLEASQEPNFWIGWDGRYRGKKVNPGVYVYYVQITMIDGEAQIYKGDITVIE